MKEKYEALFLDIQMAESGVVNPRERVICNERRKHASILQQTSPYNMSNKAGIPNGLFLTDLYFRIQWNLFGKQTKRSADKSRSMLLNIPLIDSGETKGIYILCGTRS